MKLTINDFKFTNLFNNFLYWWNQSNKSLAYVVRNTHNLPTIRNIAQTKAMKKPVYTKPSDLYYESGIEYGRNFALWKCLNCGKCWSSAYTWISTKFCLDNTKTMIVKSNNKQNKELWFSGAELKDQDFLLETCKDCDTKTKANKDNKVKIVRYKKLIRKDNSLELDINSPHRQDLCAKCLKGVICNNRND
uniref:3CxxC-type domain-containing protein n=1 Tax=Fusarium oxysporum f. sp. pisi TaxID=179143 RepID=A0A2C8D5J3_FUSOX|nr:TPA: hypothetical protein [Fusarium oxysporum f. sp. pisi]